MEITSSTAVANYLRGTYTTAVAGDAVIEDIEVNGDYMYVATSAGIVISIFATFLSSIVTVFVMAPLKLYSVYV